jgi:2-keto-4-pentenoate hydratase/2-oxohepta-3-ene-1,7-dioic acid hydratase in catechol pathway
MSVWRLYRRAHSFPSSAPILFYKPLSSMIGPNAPICVPKVAQPVDVHFPDYEVELTIVIGKTAKNVSEAEALDYVLGYTGANDVRVTGLPLPGGDMFC